MSIMAFITGFIMGVLATLIFLIGIARKKRKDYVKNLNEDIKRILEK